MEREGEKPSYSLGGIYKSLGTMPALYLKCPWEKEGFPRDATNWDPDFPIPIVLVGACWPNRNGIRSHHCSRSDVGFRTIGASIASIPSKDFNIKEHLHVALKSSSMNADHICAESHFMFQAGKALCGGKSVQLKI